MAKKYHEKLSNLVNELDIKSATSMPLEIKHFFSGAALYINGVISVSLSPAGLAFKLSEIDLALLLINNKAIPLKYFKNGFVKKGYALFEKPDLSSHAKWNKYFIKAIKQVYASK